MKLWMKIKWLTGVGTIFLLILFTNQIDKDNFSRIEQSVETIYSEVLFAKDKLMELSRLVHEKELAYALNDKVYETTKASAANEQIATVLTDCGEVMQSNKEQKAYGKLCKHVETLFQIEKKALANDSVQRLDLLVQLESIKYDIDELAAAQIREGRQQKLSSRAAMNTSKLFTRIEVYVLAFFAVLMLFLTLYTPKKEEEA